MPEARKHSYARYTRAAAALLGREIQLQRKSMRMTAEALAERLGVTRGTVHRLEAGDPRIALGTAFEACAILGIRLFDEDLGGLTRRLDDAAKHVALLPRYARPRRSVVDDEF